MLFGRKKVEAKNFLILDVESGSIGAALARQDRDGTMTILSELRVHTPVHAKRSASLMAGDLERLLRDIMPDVSRQAHQAGGLSQVAVFMSPPWGTPNLDTGRPDFAPEMQESLRRELRPYTEAPANFYTGAGAAAQGLRVLSPYEDKYLVCIVTHEMTELLLIHNGKVAGHATLPHGINLPLRTLRTHGGMSETEARSALRLGHLAEPLNSATGAFAQEFLSAGRELFDEHTPSRVWVVSPMGDYFAQALAHPSLGALFPQGGEVRALRPHHLAPQLGGPGGQDLFLILEALFVMYI